MHHAGYKSALARRACRYSDARPPRKTDGVLLESEIPPRMRGKGHRIPLRHPLQGIIPAYAGKRSGRSGPIAYSQDHPRVCGEKFRAYAMIWQEWGSPPHMRGKVRTASSGNTGKKDHPRICGEKTSGSKVARRMMGSPPRMRGKADDGIHDELRFGITPAYAGKSGAGRQPLPCTGDHPRVCGEKPWERLLHITAEGSPPRMRGKARRQAPIWHRHRITPAYAGKRFLY